jgi:hypothetical protein
LIIDVYAHDLIIIGIDKELIATFKTEMENKF